MRKFAPVCVFLLFGCSSTPTTESAVSDAVNSLNSIKEELPIECKTQAVEKRFAEVNKKVENITTMCKADVQAVKNANKELWATIAVLIIAILFLAKK